MILVNGEVRFAAGEIERLRPALERNIAATREEPGCVHYAYAVDLLDPDRLRVSEQWEDQASVDAHMAAPHMAEFRAACARAKVESAAIHAYEGHYLRTLIGAAPADQG